MQTIITGRHMTLGEELKDYIRHKTEKLTKYYDRIQQIDVVVERRNKDVSVEARVDVEPNSEFICTVTQQDVRSAIDVAIDKLERQLSEFKERLRNRKHPER